MQQLIGADSWLPLLPWCIQPAFRLNCVSVSSACQEEAEPGGRLRNTVLAGVPFGLLLICPTSPCCFLTRRIHGNIYLVSEEK